MAVTYLVFVAGTLAVLSDGLQGLANKVHVILIYVKAEQAEASRGASTNAVQELESLAHQVVVGLVVLVAKEILQAKTGNRWLHLKQLDLKSSNFRQQRRGQYL